MKLIINKLEFYLSLDELKNKNQLPLGHPMRIYNQLKIMLDEVTCVALSQIKTRSVFICFYLTSLH
jgi:hypothetical protein